MTTILIICTYNRSVSKMASAYLESRLKEGGFELLDAGLSVRKGDRIAEGAQEALRRQGLITERTAGTLLSLKEIKQADLILCPTAELVRKVTDAYTSARGKTLHMMTYAPGGRRDVFEPRKDAESHLNCLKMMMPGLDAIAEKLTRQDD